MLRVKVTTLLALFALAYTGCATPVMPNPPPPLSEEVRQNAKTYHAGGFDQPKEAHVTIEDVTVPLEGGYVMKVFDVRTMTAPIADFRGPDINLHPPNPFHESVRHFPSFRGSGYSRGFGGSFEGKSETNILDFEPFHGLRSSLFLFLDQDFHLTPYLLEGLEYDASPYDHARDKKRADLLETITSQVAGNSWTEDPKATIGYYGGLLVVQHKPDVVKEVETLIELLRVSPGE